MLILHGVRVPEKNGSKFTVILQRSHLVLAECLRRNCLHDKDQCLITGVVNFLFCCWQVYFLKTIPVLTTTSSRQICDKNKVPMNPIVRSKDVLLIACIGSLWASA